MFFSSSSFFLSSPCNHHHHHHSCIIRESPVARVSRGKERSLFPWWIDLLTSFYQHQVIQTLGTRVSLCHTLPPASSSREERRERETSSLFSFELFAPSSATGVKHFFTRLRETFFLTLVLLFAIAKRHIIRTKDITKNLPYHCVSCVTRTVCGDDRDNVSREEKREDQLFFYSEEWLLSSFRIDIQLWISFNKKSDIIRSTTTAPTRSSTPIAFTPWVIWSAWESLSSSWRGRIDETVWCITRTPSSTSLYSLFTPQVVYYYYYTASFDHWSSIHAIIPRIHFHLHIWSCNFIPNR